MSEPDQVRVVVVDDHAIVRDGLVALLSAMEGTRRPARPPTRPRPSS